MSHAMTADSMFTDRFEFPEGFVHERCAKPLVALTPHMHWSMDLPGDFGRATLDTYYGGRDGIYSRAVAMKTGEVAWFRVTKSASRIAESEQSADENSGASVTDSGLLGDSRK